MDQVDKIIAYEQGDLDHDGIVELFQELLDSGLVWRLQGHYGRTAARLLEMGLITRREDKTCATPTPSDSSTG